MYKYEIARHREGLSDATFSIKCNRLEISPQGVVTFLIIDDYVNSRAVNKRAAMVLPPHGYDRITLVGESNE